SAFAESVDRHARQNEETDHYVLEPIEHYQRNCAPMPESDPDERRKVDSQACRCNRVAGDRTPIVKIEKPAHRRPRQMVRQELAPLRLVSGLRARFDLPTD